MGGLIDSVFGGGGKKQAGKALDFMKQVYGENKAMATPWVNTGSGMFSAYGDMLTGPNQSQAFENWLNSSDYKFTTQQGLDAINHNMASKGLMNSGSTLKAITQFGQDNAQRYRDNYMNQLLGGANIGAGVMGNLMGANQQSAEMMGNMRMQKAQSGASSVGNFLNFGLGVAGMISDERAKGKMTRVGTIEKGPGKGLPLYSYHYKGERKDAQPHIGVKAQDVAKKVPQAPGPKIGNFMTVDYRELVNA